LKKQEDLEKECSDDEFMAMYEQYEAFDDLEEAYMDMEERVTAQILRGKSQWTNGSIVLPFAE
jgi:hypothetical protein